MDLVWHDAGYGKDSQHATSQLLRFEVEGGWMYVFRTRPHPESVAVTSVFVPKPPRKPPSGALPDITVVKTLCGALGVPVALVLGRSRQPQAVEPRHAVMLALRERGWSLKRIGRVMERDHSTVSSAVEKVDERLVELARWLNEECP